MAWYQMDSATAYFDDPAVSQSQLKALIKGLGSFKNVDPDAEEPTHFIHGSALDCKLLTPSLMDREFYTSKLVKKPSDTMMSIARLAFSTSPDKNIDSMIARSHIYNAINIKGYYMNRRKDNFTMDKRPDDVIKAVREYWNDLVVANGRSILSQEDSSLIDRIALSFRSHRHTAKYFYEDQNVDMITQMPIYFTYRGMACKALLDMVLVDHAARTIQVIDVKTIGESTKAFPRNAKKFRYDIQAAWYTLAISSIKSFQANSLLSINLENYTILPFKFMVESTSYPGSLPLMYTVTTADLSMGRYGGSTINRITSARTKTTRETVINHHGFEHGLTLYEWHQHHNQWEIDRHIVEAEGDLPLQTWNL